MYIYIIVAESEGLQFELLVNGVVMLSNYSGAFENEFSKINSVLSPGKNHLELRACSLFPAANAPKLNLKLTKGQKGEKLAPGARIVEFGIPSELDISGLKEWTNISNFEFKVENKFSPVWRTATTNAPSRQSAMSFLQYLSDLLTSRDTHSFVKFFDLKLQDAALAFGFDSVQLRNNMLNMLDECMEEGNFATHLPDADLLTIKSQANGKVYTLLDDKNEPALKASFGDGDLLPFDIHISDIGGKWVISR